VNEFSHFFSGIKEEGSGTVFPLRNNLKQLYSFVNYVIIVQVFLTTFLSFDAVLALNNVPHRSGSLKPKSQLPGGSNG